MPGCRFIICFARLPMAVVAAVCLASGCLPHKEDPEYTDELYNLRLTEIHYNPADCGTTPGDSLEFIEIKNAGSTTLELGGVEFVYGISYFFPVDVTLGPGEFYIIASSKKSFKTCYGVAADAEYAGLLRNSSDTIKAIHVNSGNVILFQFYADSGLWPKAADGDGYSLVATTDGETGPDAWRSSTKLNGSPGADDELKPFDSTLYDLRICEIQYNPQSALDTLGADSLEFVELKNIGSKPVNLTDVEFVKGIDYRFAPGTTLKTGELLVLASNAAWFEKRYGAKPFDTYDGQLRNSGETLMVREVKAAVTLLAISYSDKNPWPSKADGDGWSLVTLSENPGRDDQNNPAAWRPSFRIHGSPGMDDPGIVLVNEVLPHTDLPDVDAIELHNPGFFAVDISGWFLTDRATDPIRYRIPDGTRIPPGGYKVFTADEFHGDSANAGSFALSEFGDEAYIMSDATGCGGYCHGCAFGAMENGVSYGRYIVPSTGNEVFVPLTDVTLGAKNSGPLVGPLVISEIMYQPGSGKAEYIEVTNIGTREIPLYDKDYPNNTWRLQVEEQNLPFPRNVSVKADESFIVAFTTGGVDAFRNAYGINAGIVVFPFSGTLPDSSAKVELEKPLPPEKDSTGAIIGLYFMECEKVSYKNMPPWPTGANGSGSSIARRANSAFGNDPANWITANPGPGK